LVENQSVTYELTSEVEANDQETVAYLEDFFAGAVLGELGFDPAELTVVESKEDIEWIKLTVIENSPNDVLIEPELKVRGQQSNIVGELTKDSTFPLPLYIPTTGISPGYVIKTTAEEGSGSPEELEFNRIVDTDIAGASVKAFEFLGSAAAEAIDSTVTAYYERNTGILVNFLFVFEGEDPQIGNFRAEVGLEAVEIATPTTITISLPAEIKEDQNLVVTGKIMPAVSEGQVILTYQKDGSSEQPIMRTVPVTDGSFSDSYKLGMGSYTVSAEYPASGAYLSSTADKKILEVTIGDQTLMTYAIIGVVVFFGIVAGIIIGIYFAVKKIRRRRKEASLKNNQLTSAGGYDGVNTAAMTTAQQEINHGQVMFEASDIDAAYKNALIRLSEFPDSSIIEKEPNVYIKAKTGSHVKARVKGFAMCDLRDLPTDVFVDLVNKKITVKDATGPGIKWGASTRINRNLSEIASELKQSIEQK
jgi:hypothetical protein